MFDIEADKTIVLADSNTVKLLPGLGLDLLPRIVIPSGDENKNIQTLSFVWSELADMKATRHSLLVNAGGGMVCDLGGMAASTFKRGMRFINIPTTLLAMVDASAGGKVGINHCGVKNLVGLFNEPERVLLRMETLCSLDVHNILSGYAEMIKHGLLSGQNLYEKTLSFDILNEDVRALEQLVYENIAFKNSVVSDDFRESGKRKILNFGHTVGHAIEALLGGSQLHGYCVAWGMLVAAYLSVTKAGFPREELTRLQSIVRELYGVVPVDCKSYDRLYELMSNDKKNKGERVNFTLLRSIGEAITDCDVSRDDIFEAIDFIR